MMLMLVMMFVLVIIVVIIIIIVNRSFYFGYPGSRGGHLVKVKEIGVDDFIEVNVAIVAFNDFGLGLQCADNLADAAQFLRLHV